jgi:osmotically-inducible protein OsmY
LTGFDLAQFGGLPPNEECEGIRTGAHIMIGNAMLREDVIAELEFEPSIDAAEIGVAVDNGVVTLSGHVPNYAQKIAAEKAAQRVKGVRAVAVDLEVRLPAEAKHDDDKIASRAANILSWSVGVGDNVKVLVDGGWVTLSGEVPWFYQKQEAERLIRQLEGVIGVSNSVAVRSKVQASDVQQRIAEAFKRSADLESAGIRVDVSGSTVTLSGKVKAWYERKMAEDAAWAIPGVTDVRDNIVLQ